MGIGGDTLPEVGAIGQTQSQTPQKKTEILTDKDIAKNVMGKEDFLRLLVTELKNQDPLNPLDSKETVAQLAQFSELEAIMNMSTAMDRVGDMQKSLLYAQAASLVGKKVEGTVDKVKIVKRGDTPTIKFELKKPANIKINIYNKDGDLIRTVDGGEKKEGLNDVTWDGKDSDGLYVDPGEYEYEIVATYSDGSTEDISTSRKGVVKGVEFKGTDIILELENGEKLNLLDLDHISP